jgi:hypothetical protein
MIRTISTAPAQATLRTIGGAVLRGWVIVALAGCSALSTPGADSRYWVPAGTAQPTTDAGSLLHYYGYVSVLSGTRPGEERERQRRAWQADKSDFRRIQYAIALTGPSATAADRRLSAQLLAPIVQHGEGHDAELHWLAAVLARNAELEDKAQAAAQLQRRFDATAKELERKAETMKELERKLEAMKEIELQLLQRGRAPAPGTKP